ncbi:hypothetical protein [Flavobacterium sp.]|uniref:hypothetical protein n=1 Tax=Flavobacterium sp. TaxID=239 RepID=UPI00379F9F72
MKTSLLKFYIIAFYLCSTFVSFAQIGSQDSTNDLESTDAPAAPINDYLWILALCGLIFVFFRLKSYSKQENP